jgi:hypothetical protein
MKPRFSYELCEAKSDGGWFVMHNSHDGLYWVPVSVVLPKDKAVELMDKLNSNADRGGR